MRRRYFFAAADFAPADFWGAFCAPLSAFAFLGFFARHAASCFARRILSLCFRGESWGVDMRGTYQIFFYLGRLGSLVRHRAEPSGSSTASARAQLSTISPAGALHRIFRNRSRRCGV